jgi:hypothetical protein
MFLVNSVNYQPVAAREIDALSVIRTVKCGEVNERGGPMKIDENSRLDESE